MNRKEIWLCLGDLTSKKDYEGLYLPDKKKYTLNGKYVVVLHGTRCSGEISAHVTGLKVV